MLEERWGKRMIRKDKFINKYKFILIEYCCGVLEESKIIFRRVYKRGRIWYVLKEEYNFKFFLDVGR